MGGAFLLVTTPAFSRGSGLRNSSNNFYLLESDSGLREHFECSRPDAAKKLTDALARYRGLSHPHRRLRDKAVADLGYSSACQWTQTP